MIRAVFVLIPRAYRFPGKLSIKSDVIALSIEKLPKPARGTASAACGAIIAPGRSSIEDIKIEG